jgi:protein SCO1/2
LTKLFEKPLFWVVLVLILFGLPLGMSLSRPQPELPPVLGQIPEFSLINQDGRAVTKEDFRGSVVVVNFIFTSCPDVCPVLTAQMAKLQSRIIGNGPWIKLASISVDPETDVPWKLKKYGEQFKAAFRSWSFLTGPLPEIERVVVGGFKSAMDRAAPSHPEPSEDGDLFSMTHGEKFVVVDQLGQIRGYFPAKTAEDLDHILKVVAILANTRPKELGSL